MTVEAVSPAASVARHVLALRPALRADLCALRHAMRSLRGAVESLPRQNAMLPRPAPAERTKP